MKTKILMLLTLLLAGASVHAAPQPAITVAVYDFSDVDKNIADLGSKVTTLVTAGLTTETNLIMLERVISLLAQ